MKKLSLFLMLMTGILLTLNAHAESPSPLTLTISSSKTLSGTAGDYVTVTGQIINTGNSPINDITTYLSLADTANKLPVDLEDWSAEKGLYIGTIEPGQSLPLSWKVHFVKAGHYTLALLAITSGNEKPEISTITFLNVAAKQNLNPGRVLPIALGVPLLVLFLLLILSYRRQNKFKINNQ